jgi:hypothetical protein
MRRLFLQVLVENEQLKTEISLGGSTSKKFKGALAVSGPVGVGAERGSYKVGDESKVGLAFLFHLPLNC